MDYLELIPKPAKETVNLGLQSPKLATLRTILGEPRDSYTGDCQPVTGAILGSRIETRSVGPFKATGVDLALDSLASIMDAVETEIPDLHKILGSAGMTCARKRKIRQPGGTIRLSSLPSNHSWGLAIDLQLNGHTDRQGDDHCYRGLLILARYFNAAGWYWGVSYPTEDAMHFEVSQSLLLRWRKEGLI
jgi:hypothetical protein